MVSVGDIWHHGFIWTSDVDKNALINLKKKIQRQERREKKEMEEASLRKFIIVPASIFV